jgi:hypothetical protein
MPLRRADFNIGDFAQYVEALEISADYASLFGAALMQLQPYVPRAFTP